MHLNLKINYKILNFHNQNEMIKDYNQLLLIDFSI